MRHLLLKEKAFNAPNKPESKTPFCVLRWEKEKIMLEVRFHLHAEDALLKFAVIAARYNDKWVFCRHRQRSTYECPGGHREPGETVEQAARRELWEETGASDYTLKPVCAYSVADGSAETFGMLYFAEIAAFKPLPDSEIGEVVLLDGSPSAWTYPLIQPKLLKRVEEFLSDKP